jgi:hypothetical protein
MKAGCRVGVVALLTAPWVVAAPALKDRPAPPPVVGEWEVEKAIVTGDRQIARLEFAAPRPRYTFTAAGGWIDSAHGDGRYTVDLKASPPAIKLSRPANDPTGESTVSYSGTFRVEGDFLTLTLSLLLGRESTTTLRRVTKD